MWLFGPGQLYSVSLLHVFVSQMFFYINALICQTMLLGHTPALLHIHVCLCIPYINSDLFKCRSHHWLTGHWVPYGVTILELLQSTIFVDWPTCWVLLQLGIEPVSVNRFTAYRIDHGYQCNRKKLWTGQQFHYHERHLYHFDFKF